MKLDKSSNFICIPSAILSSLKRKKSKGLYNAIFKSNLELLILTTPAILYFFVFHYLPMGGIIIAFKNYRYDLGILGSKWIGLKNFEFFFTSQDAFRVTRNTVGYSTAFIIFGIISAITVALLLFEIRSKLAIKFYQTVMILPRFLSWVIVAYISYLLLNPIHGVLNQVLSGLGLERILWYSSPKYWPPILVNANIWNSIGMNCIIYYAALLGVDESMYEAAIIDGASRLQQTRYISIPSLVPLMTILTILQIGNLFRGDFGLFYQLSRDIGTLYPATDIIDTYVFRGLQQGNFGITSAVGFFQSFVGLILVVVSNGIIKKIKPENSLF